MPSIVICQGCRDTENCNFVALITETFPPSVLGASSPKPSPGTFGSFWRLRRRVRSTLSSRCRWSAGRPLSSLPASIFTWYPLRVHVQFPPFYKGSTRVEGWRNLLQNDPTTPSTNYTCNDPISSFSHILKFWRLGRVSTYEYWQRGWKWGDKIQSLRRKFQCGLLEPVQEKWWDISGRV